jgi:hypothetical protein
MTWFQDDNHHILESKSNMQPPWPQTIFAK